MERVTKRVRSVKSKKGVKHLIFTDPQHKIDMLAADRLRSVEFVAMGPAEMKARVPFPDAGKFSAVSLFVENGLKEVKGPEFEAALAAAREDGRVWFTDTGKRRLDDAPILQRREGNGLSDCYFSFPPWVGEHLAEMVEAGQGKEAKKLAGRVIRAVGEELARRTGYMLVGCALHPDSRGAVGFHLQYQTASKGKLLGRSADGKVGRKGLRLLGDAMLAVSRFGEFISLDAKARKAIKKKDFDDVALDKVMMATLEKELGESWEKIKENGKTYSVSWKKRRDEALAEGGKVGRLERENKSLREKLEFLEKQNESLTEEGLKLATKVEKLEKTLDAMRKAFGPV